MAQTIPFSEVVDVVPSVLSAGGDAVDLNGLVLSQSSYAPVGEILEFTDAQSVADYFGATSTEANAAAIYFKGVSIGTKLPGQIMFTRYPETATAGTLRSASLASMTLSQMQALSGTIDITVAGTLYSSSSINLSGASSFSAAASDIQGAFTAPPFTVAYDSTAEALVFTTSGTGSAQTITDATGTLSAALYLTSGTGAVLSQGADAAVPATFMNGIIAQNQNWATFTTTWEPQLTEKEAFAAWSNANEPRYLYVAYDSDIGAKTPNNTTTFGNYLQTTKSIGTLPIWGDITHAAFAMGWAASLDFTRLNGRSTLCFKMQSGLMPSITTSTDYNAVKSNGYNCYGAFGSNNPANNANWFTPGSVSGSWDWADTYVNQIWLNANLQLAMVTLLQQVGSIPYNTQGYGLVRAACMDPINAAANFGAIREGVSLSSAQKAEIQYALGFDASAAITAQGYYLQIQDAAASTRTLRQSPPMTLYYQDGESIQQLTLASIAIQ